MRRKKKQKNRMQHNFTAHHDVDKWLERFPPHSREKGDAINEALRQYFQKNEGVNRDVPRSNLLSP